MTTTAALFDVFGTVIKIEDRRNPHLQLLRLGRQQGRWPRPSDVQMIMTHELSWQELASRLGIRVSNEQLRYFAHELEAELLSMKLYPDAQPAIERLQGAGIKIALCSNLACGYGPAVRELLPGLDRYAFSYELAVMKPEPAIYQDVCRGLGGQPGQQLWGDQIVMIGDSIRCDRDGARAAGISGFHLCRQGRGDFESLSDFVECVLEG